MAGEAGQGSAGAAGGIARRGDRAAVRHPLRHAIRTVRSLDPAWPLAPDAGPAGPHLATSLREAPEPSAVVIDSRSCRSAPSCFDRGIDGGRKTRGVKINVAADKYGIPLAIDVSPANRHDTKA